MSWSSLPEDGLALVTPRGLWTLRDLIPRRMAHFGRADYEFIWWLRRKWRRKPITGGLMAWLGWGES